MLTPKEWDAISSELEPQVMPDYGEKQQKYLWSVYGGLLQHMKDRGMSIDEVLVICEEQVSDKKNGVSEDNERKSVQ